MNKFLKAYTKHRKKFNKKVQMNASAKPHYTYSVGFPVVLIIVMQQNPLHFCTFAGKSDTLK